ncbi:ABC transporter substrate-binding protein [Brachybacterium sacelli]|uniref:Raffinose/stachyose/melibiose transport system substrate-binding protein n=1 Tax=Brachybacterium sacelli TaxID=173364 RepID=A0ABS4X0S8_9MICO|nr:extracellular solute-binding protein [Brachybacterium sacelli]MBP2381324.1 raffinose/stachyose/melibiose transport system substrate-binding protein [Brachybacterium sacelli]
MTPSSPPGPPLSRRTLFAAGGAFAAAGLAGCGGSGRAEVTFYQSKREAIQYFAGLLTDFDDSHRDLRVVHDIATNLSASFVRKTPPDIACQNYNLEMARFMERGALSDLADMPEAEMIREDVQDLADWYPTYEGRTSVIPFSVAGAAVIYNRRIFEEHGLEVPETWSDFLGVCETLRGAGVTPIYGTFADPWTVNQGLFDYTIGGMIDVRSFFEQMNEIGEDVGPDSEVSFQTTMLEPIERMLELLPYHQDDAASRVYGDGNTAVARGEAAMLFQGPWALAEIEKAGSEEELSTFPLPATEDPAERKIRVSIDLSLWIPEAAGEKDGARELLSYFMTPEVQHPYNEALLALGTTKEAPPASDPRIAPMQEFYDAGMYTGAPSQFIPLTIPWENYLQSIIYGADPEGVLARLDSDWARLAYRS